jgi:hypothetical protein
MKSFIKKYKVLRLILIAFGLFFIEQNLAFSTNCDPCSGNCVFHGPVAGQYGFRVTDPNYFHESGTIYLDLDRVCYYDIRFQIRECTCPNGTTTWEIFIDKIEFYGDCQFYNQNEKIRAIQSAIKTLLRHTPLYFVPESELYRFWNGWDVMIDMNACWTWNASTSALEPCPYFDCCRTKYVIRPANGTFEIVDKFNINQPSPTSCGGVVGGSCFFACDANDLPIGSLNSDESVVCSNPCPNTPWDGNIVYFNDFPRLHNSNPYLYNGMVYFGKVLNSQITINGYEVNIQGYFKTNECGGNKYIYLEKMLIFTYDYLTDDDIAWAASYLIRIALAASRGYFRQNLNPDNPNANYTVTVIVPKCWQRFAGYPALVAPCPGTDCCSLDFTIGFDLTYYTQQLRSATMSLAYRLSYVCRSPSYNSSYFICSQNCYDICTLFANTQYFNWYRDPGNDDYAHALAFYPCPIPGEDPFPRKGDYTFDFNERDNSIEKISVIPIPASDEIKIICRFEDNGEVKLCVNNLVGDIMLSQQFNKNSYQEEFNMQTKNLPQGVYTLSVIYNGEVISRKLFVILR